MFYSNISFIRLFQVYQSQDALYTLNAILFCSHRKHKNLLYTQYFQHFQSYYLVFRIQPKNNTKPALPWFMDTSPPYFPDHHVVLSGSTFRGKHPKSKQQVAGDSSHKNKTVEAILSSQLIV